MCFCVWTRAQQWGTNASATSRPQQRHAAALRKKIGLLMSGCVPFWNECLVLCTEATHVDLGTFAIPTRRPFHIALVKVAKALPLHCILHPKRQALLFVSLREIISAPLRDREVRSKSSASKKPRSTQSTANRNQQRLRGTASPLHSGTTNLHSLLVACTSMRSTECLQLTNSTA